VSAISASATGFELSDFEHRDRGLFESLKLAGSSPTLGELEQLSVVRRTRFMLARTPPARVDEGEHQYCASWLLWANSSQHGLSLPRAIDHALADYMFYPEGEWTAFGYHPPESATLLGAWRDASGQAFAFLLEKETRGERPNGEQFLLYVSGLREPVEQLGRKVTALKSSLTKSERRELESVDAGRRIEREQKSPAVGRLLKLIGLFTVLINAFSLYLRQLPAPALPTRWIHHTYQGLVVAVHLSSLLLLLAITIIGIGYVVRYGILMFRRL
jgi:hypothetical protein